MPRSPKRKKKLPLAPPPVSRGPSPAGSWLAASRNALGYRPDFRRLAFSAAVLLGSFAAVVLWMMFGPYALFPPEGFIDPWLYPGYFMNFSYLFQHHGITYYLSRLPWILPGMAAFAVASPPIASLLLCSAVITVSAVSLYWSVRWHYGNPPALLAAVALATNPYFMSSASWHYPDGPAIAYAMVAFALYLRPRGRKWNSVPAAAALALSGFTNMSAGPMILSVLAIPFWRNLRSRKGLLREAVCALAGVALATLILMAVSKKLLHDPLFFMAQIKMVQYTRDHPSYLLNMWGTGSGFLLTAFRLFLPVFLLAFAAVLMIAIRRPAGPLWIAFAAAAVCLLLYSIDQFARQGVTLRVSYHSSYMLVPMFGLAGTLLGELWKRVRESAAALPLLLTAGCLLPVAWNRWAPPHVAPAPAWIALAVLGAAGILLAILQRRPSPSLTYAASGVLICATFLGPAVDPVLQYIWALPAIAHGSNLSNGPHAETYQAIMELQDDLKGVDPARRLEFWWDPDERVGNFCASAAAINMSGFHEFAKALSSGSRAEIEDLISPYATLVHLTTHPERIRKRTQLLVSRGIVLGPERTGTILLRGERILMSLEDVWDMSHIH